MNSNMIGLPLKCRTLGTVALVASAGAVVNASEPLPLPAPNIILINVDDLGWRDVGFMGSEYYETPNIDKLAAQRMGFTNAYASAANCAPSRACMMSGKWVSRHGIFTVDNSDRGESRLRKLIPVPNNTILPKNIPIIPEILQQNGYITCHAGKWHLSDDPIKRGFDFNIGGSHAGNPGSYYPPYKNVLSLKAPSPKYYLTNLIMDKTLEFLNSHQNNSFFLYYAPYAVHTPLQPVNNLLPKYEDKAEWNGQTNRAYATMIENLDIQVGRLVEFLEKTGIMNNTFIMFTSDNGGVFNITRQRPLRAGKGSPYEGGIRVPMFAVWKGKITEGTKNDTPVTNIDFLPTILDIAGIRVSQESVIDGESILPVLTATGTIKARPLFWHFPVYLEGGNEECQDTIFRTRPGSSIRMGKWKLIQYFENNDLELYDLNDDVGEKNNIAELYPQKTRELLDVLEKWRRDTQAPVPVLLNDNYVE